MDLNEIQIFGMLQDKMKHSSARQKVIAENIANADTPDYKRKEIEKLSFQGMVDGNLKLKRTDAMHIPVGGNNGDYKVNITDNKVQLDTESIEMMQNSGDYAATTQTYKKFLSIMKIALGDGGG